MTTIAQAREAIYQEWSDNWTSTSVWTLENERFDEPDEGTDWARVTVRSLPGGQETLGKEGDRKYQRSGSVIIQLFTSAGSGGLATSDAYSRSARDIYEGKSFDGLFFNNGQIREIGPDGKFYQTVVEVFFDYFETK